jgi:hypothetical protein
MKTGQIFWGIFFLTTGALILLTKYDLLFINWGFIWDLWPLVFIFWGLAVIFKGKSVKPFVTALFGLFLALFIFGIFCDVFSPVESNSYEDHDDYKRQTYSADYEGIDYAKFELGTGAGRIYLNGTTDNLIRADAKGIFEDYKFHSYSRDDRVTIKLNMSDRHINFFGPGIKNYLDVRLNENPIWDIQLNLGAAKSKINLAPFKVEKLEINTGASGMELELGDRFSKTDVYIEMGVAALDIKIPKESGCRITGDMTLMSKDLPGFRKFNSDNYETENFDDAENLIYIKIDGAVSSLDIIRY